jgi:hypothetical protein
MSTFGRAAARYRSLSSCPRIAAVDATRTRSAPSVMRKPGHRRGLVAPHLSGGGFALADLGLDGAAPAAAVLDAHQVDLNGQLGSVVEDFRSACPRAAAARPSYPHLEDQIVVEEPEVDRQPAEDTRRVRVLENPVVLAVCLGLGVVDVDLDRRYGVGAVTAWTRCQGLPAACARRSSS